jgi:2-methylcitrate dehydratase PrpD
MRVIDAPTMLKDGSGWGAMAGVSAAYLAQDGFTGAPAITMEASELANYWNDLGQNWYIEQQYIKLYPVCRWAQPAVEGALALIHEHGINVSEIATIKVETFHEAKRLASIPTTTEQAQYSLPFSVASAVVRGTIGVAEVTSNGLNDPQIIGLAKTVEIVEDDAFNDAFPAHRFARTHFHLQDGRILSSRDTEAQGDPENKVPDQVIWDKLRGLASPLLGEAWSEQFLSLAWSIVDAPSVTPLFELIAQTAQTKDLK